MSGVVLSGELAVAHAENGVTVEALAKTMRDAAQASFLPADVREDALRKLGAG
jgi:hypothetical protein